MFLLPQRDPTTSTDLWTCTLQSMCRLLRYAQRFRVYRDFGMSNLPAAGEMAATDCYSVQACACWSKSLIFRWVKSIKVHSRHFHQADRDRGGVRGIVELEVLKAIERELPANIPITSFFELIVGTRYGHKLFLSRKSHLGRLSCKF